MAAQRGTPQQRSLERRSISAAIIIVQPLWGYRGLFEAMSLVAIVALAAYLLVSRKKGTMRRELEEAEKR